MNALNRYFFPVVLCGMFSSSAMALDTAVVQVNATVTGVCRFITGGSVDFALNPASAADATGTVAQPQFWCTKGTAYAIADDTGLNESGAVFRMKHATLNEFIPYTFTYTSAGAGQGRSTPVIMDIAGTVANADFVNASEGSYSDTVTLTILP